MSHPACVPLDSRTAMRGMGKRIFCPDIRINWREIARKSNYNGFEKVKFKNFDDTRETEEFDEPAASWNDRL